MQTNHQQITAEPNSMLNSFNCQTQATFYYEAVTGHAVCFVSELSTYCYYSIKMYQVKSHFGRVLASDQSEIFQEVLGHEGATTVSC